MQKFNVFRSVFSTPKSIQAMVTLLENLHVILEKTPRDDIRSEVLPMLYNAFESTTIQVQVRNVGNVTGTIRPKFKLIFESLFSEIPCSINNITIRPGNSYRSIL